MSEMTRAEAKQPMGRDSVSGLFPLRIGVSACLIGREVRYDGGHKLDRFLADALGWCVEWIPVCPEVEIGLGVRRKVSSASRRG